MPSTAATESQWWSSTDLLWCWGCCRSHSSGLRCTSAIRRLTSSEPLPDMVDAPPGGGRLVPVRPEQYTRRYDLDLRGRASVSYIRVGTCSARRGHWRARVFGTTWFVRVVYARFTGRLPAPPLHAGGDGGGDDGLAESRIDKPAAGNRDCGGCCSRANVNGHGRLRSTESPLRWVAPIL